jgi:hypothetical protein
MSTAVVSRPKLFWVVAVAALLWNLIGVLMFFLQVGMTPEQLAALPSEQRQIHEAAPSWLDIAYGVAVFAGVLGAIGLLLRKRWAVTLFLLSLLAVLVQMVSVYLLTPAWTLLGPSGLVMPLVIVLIALGLWMYSSKAAARGWLS